VYSFVFLLRSIQPSDTVLSALQSDASRAHNTHIQNSVAAGDVNSSDIFYGTKQRRTRGEGNIRPTTTPRQVTPRQWQNFEAPSTPAAHLKTIINT